MRGGLPTPRTPVSLCSRALRAAQCVPSAAAHRQAQDSPARASSAPHMARIAENSDATNPLCRVVPAFLPARLAARLAARRQARLRRSFLGTRRLSPSMRAIASSSRRRALGAWGNASCRARADSLLLLLQLLLNALRPDASSTACRLFWLPDRSPFRQRHHTNGQTDPCC